MQHYYYFGTCLSLQYQCSSWLYLHGTADQWKRIQYGKINTGNAGFAVRCLAIYRRKILLHKS